jgi:hypothetical protein
MSQSLVGELELFTAPRDEAQLRKLESALGSVPVGQCGPREFRALLNVFERFPGEDGFDVFWSIVHYLEACNGYEQVLVESVRRAPVDFSVLMVNRLLNAGVTEINGQSLCSLLESVASNPANASGVRKSAQSFIDYQAANVQKDA